MVTTGAISEGRRGGLLRVRVTPRSHRDEILPDFGEEIRVKVKASPAAGEANKALVRLFARVLEVPSRDVEIASGRTSRRKTVRVLTLSAREIERRLARWIEAASGHADGGGDLD